MTNSTQRNYIFVIFESLYSLKPVGINFSQRDVGNEVHEVREFATLTCANLTIPFHSAIFLSAEPTIPFDVHEGHLLTVFLRKFT